MVAIVRGDGVIASPVPGELLRGGDALVVIGTDTAIDGVRRIVTS